jgi:7-cyano-7-deazaguanine reductase
LNSFNEVRFADMETVKEHMRQDLSHAAGEEVDVVIDIVGKDNTAAYQSLDGISIDDADIDVDVYQPASGLLRCVEQARAVSETLTSDLLKSNCPVTGQPDWGSVQIRYSGPQIDREALLKYIISLRQHSEFHEHCVEKMFCDIWQVCKPDSLCVYARYTRRGGLDINPWRSSEPVQISQTRTIRQ